jgi:tripartite-type tricarboxylate transporter receptor subunit TctC
MKTWLAAILTALACVAAAPLSAQTYPDRPVRIIVPFTAGGGTDAIARLVAQKLGERWGQSVFVENRTGANGNIGAHLVATAKPDGYTVLVSTSAIPINLAINLNTGYELKDLQPVVELTAAPFLLIANPKLVEANTFPEFLKWAKAANPPIAWASTSEGNAEHLAGMLLQQMAGFKMRHIPYRGGADALKDVLGGQVPVGVVSLPTSQPYIQAKAIKVLGVTDSRRAPQLPDVPTIEESGVKGYALPTWYAVWLPAGTPPAVVEKLNADINAVLKMEDVKQRVIAQGFNTVGGTVPEFTAYVQSEADRYVKLVDSLGLTKQ